MKKIPTLFERSINAPQLVTSTLVKGCEWILEGSFTPTVKWDGTSCRSMNGTLYRRHEIRKREGRFPEPPPAFVPADSFDDKIIGWMPVQESNPADKWHVEALALTGLPPAGTYELVGPKVNGNAQNFDRHYLVRHGIHVLDIPRFSQDGIATPGEVFDRLRTLLQGPLWYSAPIEGIVFYGPEGQLAKIKRRDFGYSWPVKGGNHEWKVRTVWAGSNLSIGDFRDEQDADSSGSVQESGADGEPTGSEEGS